MKKITIIITALLVAVTSIAQPSPQTAKDIKQAMAKLSYFTGNWKGEANVSRGPNNQIKVNQEEIISFKLDSTILIVEGIGRNPDPSMNQSVVFNAFAVISFDPVKKEYKMRSYTKEGMTTEAYFKITEPNKYEWGFDVPQGKIKYEIVHDPVKKTWVEKGFFSRDGNQWFPTMSMDLVKL